jgi:hypothetical protein
MIIHAITVSVLWNNIHHDICCKYFVSTEKNMCIYNVYRVYVWLVGLTAKNRLIFPSVKYTFVYIWPFLREPCFVKNALTVECLKTEFK